MKLEIRKNSIVLTPEGSIEQAYIEDTLGLKKDGDYIKLVRKTGHCYGEFVKELETEKVKQ